MELEGPITEAAATESKIVRVEPEKTINPDNEKQIALIEDVYARFTQWQKGVDEAVKTAANQAKIAEIRKTEPKINHPQWFYGFADRLDVHFVRLEIQREDFPRLAAAFVKCDVILKQNSVVMFRNHFCKFIGWRRNQILVAIWRKIEITLKMGPKRNVAQRSRRAVVPNLAARQHREIMKRTV